MKNVYIALVACLLFGEPAAFAQPAPPGTDGVVRLYELILRDGSRLFGSIEHQSDASVEFRTPSGTLVTAKRTEIESLKEITGSLVDGEFLRSDPNVTRLFFGPTGRSLQKGQGYLGVYGLFVPFVQYGLTDRISLGGGTPLIFGIDEEDRPFWVTPKVQVLHAGSTDVAVGVMHAFTGGDGKGGVGYVVATRGSLRGSLTGGFGVGYAVNGGRARIVMFGGERQVRRNLAFVSENYVWKDGKGIASAGMRFFGERLSADLAFAVPLGADETFVFPVVNFVFVFGGN
jgi:hypothetical protein